MTDRNAKQGNSRLSGAALFSLCAAVLFVCFVLYARWGSYLKFSSRAETDFTSEVPEEYMSPCEHPGTVIRIDYPTKDYRNNRDIHKPAFIYLPYGYEENGSERYDVMYMMHGWMMKAQDYLTDDAQIRNVFDHLIENGDTRPFIAVCLTFDAENEAATYQDSVDQLALFQDELRNDAMPYLEAKIRTYAKGTSHKDLKAARSHRAFAGFSMGAVTAWHQFIFNLDLIQNYIIMSGDSWITGQNGGLLRPQKTVDRLVNAVHDGWYGQKDYFIYTGVGTIDPMHDQVDSQVQEMMRRQEFCAENMVYEIKDNGYHDMNAVREYLYNALPAVFAGD
ncbi:MAG: hypothetical protein IKD66_01400 [Solobacterium sp.]|nr:hypothetical protein [Solobacterium sp.]